MNYDALFIKNQSLYLGYFYNRTKDLELSRDLCQELYIKVRTELNKGKVFPVENAFITWVWRLANSVFIDDIRIKNRKQREVEVTNDDFSYYDFIPDEGLNPEEELIRFEMHETILKAVDKLSEEQREVFKMRVLGGVKFKDMVIVTGRSINTLIGQMRYARTNLKKTVYPCN